MPVAQQLNNPPLTERGLSDCRRTACNNSYLEWIIEIDINNNLTFDMNSVELSLTWAGPR